MKKIAFWKIGALGDVLMTTPLVRQTRKAFPNAQIDYLVGRSCAAIVEGNPHLSRVIKFDESILYESKLMQLGSIVSVLRGYDVIYVLDKHWVFSLLARIANIPIRVGFVRRDWEGCFLTKKIPYGPVKHEIHYYLMLGEAFGLPIDFRDVSMDLPPAAPYLIASPYAVLINSGGANAHEQSTVRRMPARLFTELIERCVFKGKVVFLGGADEWAEYEKFVVEGVDNLCGKISLHEAWSVLQNAQAVFSTDTGLMHMAGAVNANVTAIFGPTHPGRKCPPGARWVWGDEEIYDDRYELYGKPPVRKSFQKMTLENIMQATKNLWA